MIRMDEYDNKGYKIVIDIEDVLDDINKIEKFLYKEENVLKDERIYIIINGGNKKGLGIFYIKLGMLLERYGLKEVSVWDSSMGLYIAIKY